MTRVLVVEDDGIIGMSIEEMLLEHGYDCRLVTSGEDAVVTTTDYQPDIILMDIGLSRMLDGITTARIIRKDNPKLPIIYITRQEDEILFEQAKETFPTHYLIKPFTNEALYRAITLALQASSFRETHNIASDTLGEVVSNAVFVKTNENIYNKLLFADILYLEAKGSYTSICYLPPFEAKPQYYTVSFSSNHVAQKLSCPAIVKLHKSYYVNIQRIESLSLESVIVGGISIPLGKDYKADILKRVRKISKK